MPLSAEQFLAVLDENQLVPSEMIADLRRQVSQSAKPVPPAEIARLLVERGQLTANQAFRLLNPTAKPGTKAAPATGKPSADKSPLGKPAAATQNKAAPKKSSGELDDLGAMDNLGLAPMDDDLGLAPLDDIQDEPAKPAGKSAVGKPGAAASKSAGKAPSAGDAKVAGRAASPTDGLGSLGGLAEELGDAALSADGAFGAGSLLLAPKRKGFFKRFQKQLLIGGAALGGVIILASVVVVWIKRGNGDPEFAAAEQVYQSKAYADAVTQFNAMLDRFPRNKHAGQARCHRGMAELRQVLSTSGDAQPLLDKAREVLPEIESEAEFAQLQGELAPLLTSLAERLLDQAQKRSNKADERKCLAQAHEALALADNSQYVPGSVRPWQRLEAIAETLALLERDLDRAATLDKACAAIGQAAAAGKLDEADAERKKLLQVYPDLFNNAKLRDLGPDLAKAEAANVALVTEARKAETTEADRPIKATVALAVRNGPADAAAGGTAVFAVDQGVAYALDSATGRLLWRRFIGGDARYLPLSLGDDSQTDAVLVDRARNEVVRVAGPTGKVQWRLALEQPIASPPVLLGKQILVATRSGRLVAIEAALGATAQYVQFSQPLSTAPAADAKGQLLFQLGDHAYLYSLDAKQLLCKRVTYIGHEALAAPLPPMVLPKHLILAENDVENATLHVLSRDTAGLPDQEIQQEVLAGHVLTAPIVAGSLLSVTTDRGALYAFEIAADGKKPLKKLDQWPASDAPPAARFALVQDGQAWIGGQGLKRWAVPAGGARFLQKWSGFDKDVFVQPLQAAGETIVVVRRRLGLPGIAVSSIRPSGEPLWETALAAPLAAEPTFDPASHAAVAVSSLAAAFPVDLAGAQGAAVQEQAIAKPADDKSPVMSAEHASQLADGRRVLWTSRQPNEVLTLDDAASAPRRLRLPAPLACAPVGWKAGLLAPARTGQLFWLDPKTGASLAEPFQPQLEPGTRFKWSAPVIVGPSGDEIVISDGLKTVYRLGFKDDAKSRLAELAAAHLDEPIVSPLAVLGDVVYGVDAACVLRAFTLANLTAGEEWKLSAHRAAFGPQATGKSMLVATDRDELLCLGTGQKLLWKATMKYGPLAGAPLEIDGGFILASASGQVWRVARETGEEQAKIEVGEPLASGPVAMGKFLAISAGDGSLLKIAAP